MTALWPLVAEHGARHEKVDILGDIGGVVADPLDVLRRKQQVRAQADIARVLHHVGQQLAEHRIVERVEARIAAPDGDGLCRIARAEGVQHVLQLPERQLGHVTKAAHQRLRMVLRRQRQRALGDILGEIADPFEIGADLEHGHDVPQIVGHRLPLRDHDDRALLQLTLEPVDLAVAGGRALGEARIAARQGGESVSQKFLGETAHFRGDAIELGKLRIVGFDGMAAHLGSPRSRIIALVNIPRQSRGL